MYKRMVTQAGRNEKTAIFNLHRLLERVLIVSFSCFCLRYTLHLANFGHSFPGRPLFNIIDRMVIQLSMLKIEKKKCEALPKAAPRFNAEIRTCSKILQGFSCYISKYKINTFLKNFKLIKRKRKKRKM